jgi:hypothetical protein
MLRAKRNLTKTKRMNNKIKIKNNKVNNQKNRLVHPVQAHKQNQILMIIEIIINMIPMIQIFKFLKMNLKIKMTEQIYNKQKHIK